MMYFFKFILFYLPFGVKSDSVCQSAHFIYKQGMYLSVSAIETLKTPSEVECGLVCTRNNQCLSTNYKKSGENRGFCRINNVSVNGNEKYLKNDAAFVYLGIQQRDCPEKLGYYHVFGGKKCRQVTSCKELFETDKPSKNGAYWIHSTESNSPYQVYCHMDNINGCGSGGWTLAMKTDGRKDTFKYSSALWGNKVAYQSTQGLQGITDDAEAKLESFWKAPFTKVCLGMKVGGITQWIMVEHAATSLYHVFVDRKLRQITNVDRSGWKSLIAGSSLQPYCNRGGFNNGRVRIGIITNDYNNCNQCDSFIGFGMSMTITTGNVATYIGNDNGRKQTPAIGYLLVQQ